MDKLVNFILGNLSDVQEKQIIAMLLSIIKTLELAGPHTRITVLHPGGDLSRGEDRVCVMGVGIDCLEAEEAVDCSAHSNISLIDSSSHIISESGIDETESLYLAVYGKSMVDNIKTCRRLGNKYCIEMHFSLFESGDEDEPYIHVVGNCVEKLSAIADLLLIFEKDITICTEYIAFLPAKK